jgi:3-hydroxybenzoate 6-monooxygenase
MADSREILVAGGGIGGLSAALALARKGKRVRVLEKAPEFGEIGAGLQVGPNAYRMLEQLGVKAEIDACAVFPEHLIVLDAVDDAEITRVSLGRAFKERYKHPYIVIHRHDLHEVLLNACRRNDAIALETSKALTGIESWSGPVRIRCEDGSTYEGAALIGADGLWSYTRSQIVGDGKPRVSGHVAYRGTAPIDKLKDRSFVKSVVLWMGPFLHYVQYPVSEGTIVNNVAVIESHQFKQGKEQYGGPDELKEIFSHASGRVRGNLEDFINTGRNWPMFDRMPAPNWTRGNVTLLGDAAHPTLQYLAQGACQAIEDAVVLADKVEHAGTDFNPAFIAYQTERYLRTTRVVLTSRFFGHVCHASGGARDLRNHLMRMRTPETFFEVDWIYKGI